MNICNRAVELHFFLIMKYNQSSLKLRGLIHITITQAQAYYSLQRSH